MAPTTPFFRTLLRRRIESLRWNRSRNQQTRSNSSKPPPPDAADAVPTPNTIGALPLWQRLGPLTRAAHAYARSQRKRPYVTQVCTSLVIYLAADVSAQRMSGNDYDPRRTARSLVIGGLSSIPSYRWFLWLSHNFNYSSHALSILVKIAINQTCFTPLFNSYFFGMQSFLSGDSFLEILERLRRTVPTSIVNSLKLWPAVTAVNFTYVPIEYRSIFAGVIAVGWQTYLAFLNRNAEIEAEKAAAAVLAAGKVEVKKEKEKEGGVKGEVAA